MPQQCSALDCSNVGLLLICCTAGSRSTGAEHSLSPSKEHRKLSAGDDQSHSSVALRLRLLLVATHDVVPAERVAGVRSDHHA